MPGLRYSNALRDAVGHTACLSRELARLEHQQSHQQGQEWLVGRSARIEATLWLLLSELRAKKREEEETLALVLEYLVELHGTVRRLFGLDVLRHCCLEGASVGEPPGVRRLSTVAGGIARRRPNSADRKENDA
jgi:hypothetical protein